MQANQLVEFFGRKVVLVQEVDEYGDGEVVYQVGTVGRLDGVLGDGNKVFAAVEFPGGNYVDNVPLEALTLAQ